MRAAQRRHDPEEGQEATVLTRTPDRDIEIVLEPPDGGGHSAEPFAPDFQASAFPRATVRGKFLFVGEEKFYVKGVTYGPFADDSEGDGYRSPEAVAHDFRVIAQSGINAVRVYTAPPRWLLDLALRHGLRVMVGLPWEQHVAFLDQGRRAHDIVRRVCEQVRACAGHPAVLCYAVGNEIPASVVRWHGRRKVQRFLARLVKAVRREDPQALVTYVNYPSTEYLDLPFVDLFSFNVFLEQADRLDAYVARLHNIAGDRPLLLSEIGLDSRRNGEESQARTLAEQVRTAFLGGCAGAFVFSWTDEWHRGGAEILDWDFGITGRARNPKPALSAVRSAFAETPFGPDIAWPLISVVVCTYNGAKTLSDCMLALQRLEYPNHEVIVVDDGSTDNSGAIARAHGFPVISTTNMGLSSARNTGLGAATGDIVAYLDDDAYPDPHWLHYLAATFMATDCVGVGGPNLPPPGDGSVADCVANSPGGPIHVLISDRLAEHIPGCNMAFRKSALKAIGGFDPQFWVAGDDVDLCWRLHDRGWTLGFSPAAVVWHHRRNSVAAYWRQQRGYGRAEALLERKWPSRHNAVGHISWAGSVYGGAVRLVKRRRVRVYQGTWGTAPYQSKEPEPAMWSALLAMPEWYLVVAAAVGIAALGAFWRPLLMGLPIAVAGLTLPVIQAWRRTAHATFTSARPGPRRLALRGVTAMLHLLQPLARLYGRMTHGLTPWRRHSIGLAAAPIPRTHRQWREEWRSHEATLHGVEEWLHEAGAQVNRGNGYDEWDLQVRAGGLGAARLLMATEEHGRGRQLVRVRWWPRPSWPGVALCVTFIAGTAAAAAAGAWIVWGTLGLTSIALAASMTRQCAAATGAINAAVQELQ
jgi:GT2 family glycosyltransferase